MNREPWWLSRPSRLRWGARCHRPSDRVRASVPPVLSADQLRRHLAELKGRLARVVGERERADLMAQLAGARREYDAMRRSER